MPSNWSKVDHIRNAEAVDEGVSSRPDRQLEARTAYLRQRMDAAELGEGLFAYGVTFDPDVNVGQPVYFNEINNRFELALAGVEDAEGTGTLTPTAASRCLGVVAYKQNSTLGDVLLGGRAKINMTESVGAALAVGQYFLSAATAGKLTLQRPPVSVSVGFLDADGYFYANPLQRDFIEDHVHYAFVLSCLPAGEIAAMDADEPLAAVITNPNVEITGWLPADHESFGGMAPPGAKFGYNMAAHPELARVWPPIPVESAYIEKMTLGFSHRVTAGSGGTTFAQAFMEGLPTRVDSPLGATSPLVILNRDGIWWMSDQARYLPWPWFLDYPLPEASSLSSSSSVSVSEAASSSSSSAGPVLATYPDGLSRIMLYFTKMVFLTDRAVVTSLEPGEGSFLEITNCDGDAAKTGALKITENVSQLIDDADNASGYLAFKEVTDENKLRRGPVVTKLLAGSNVQISGTASGDGYIGACTINAVVNASQLEISPSDIRLDDAEQDYYQETLFTTLPNGLASSVRLRFDLAVNGIPSSPRMKLRIWLLGRANGTLPTLNVSYRRISRETAPATLPTGGAEQVLTFTTGQTVAADEYLEIESALFDVEAGEIIHVSISREAADGYGGAVGLLRLGAVVMAGS